MDQGGVAANPSLLESCVSALSPRGDHGMVPTEQGMSVVGLICCRGEGYRPDRTVFRLFAGVDAPYQANRPGGDFRGL